MSSSPHSDIEKWKQAFKDYAGFDSDKSRQVQQMESQIIIKWLGDLKLPRYDILEVGCGNGYLGFLISSWLLENERDFLYHFTDLLPEAIELTRKVASAFPKPASLKFNILDVYKLEETLGRESQDIIISTGYAAAATYKNAVPIVANSLKLQGILICDFINQLSLPVFMQNIPKSLKMRYSIKQHLRDPESKYYQFGKTGIAEYFDMHGLRLMKMEYVGLKRNPIIAMFQKT